MSTQTIQILSQILTSKSSVVSTLAHLVRVANDKDHHNALQNVRWRGERVRDGDAKVKRFDHGWQI